MASFRCHTQGSALHAHVLERLVDSLVGARATCSSPLLPPRNHPQLISSHILWYLKGCPLKWLSSLLVTRVACFERIALFAAQRVFGHVWPF